MKEILAKFLHFLSNIKVKFVCLFKLTFRLEDKDDNDNVKDTDDEDCIGKDCYDK